MVGQPLIPPEHLGDGGSVGNNPDQLNPAVLPAAALNQEYGVWGDSSGYGVIGTGAGGGVYGESSAKNGSGVEGENHQGYGVLGFGNYGVFCIGQNVGLYAETGASLNKAYLAAPSAAGDFYGQVYVHGSAGVTVEGSLTVWGPKHAAVPHPDGSRRKLYSLESPESWFEDFGKGRARGASRRQS